MKDLQKITLNDEEWQQISKIFSIDNDLIVKRQWNILIKQENKTKKWTEEEDKILNEIFGEIENQKKKKEDINCWT